MKPENLMLSQTHTSAIIKVVDFGCSEFIDQPNQPNLPRERNSTGTVAYASPERANSGTAAPSKALDMWAVGIILYIMLTGMHPLDPQGDAADEQLKEQLLKIQEKNINIIKSGDLQPFTKHLSPSAIDLLSQLLEPDPRRRIRSSQLVENSWIQGITAASGKMENSDKRLSKFRKYRSKIETKVFQNLLSHSDLPSTNAEGSLFQKAFSSLDKEDKGFLTVNDVADEDEHAKIAGPRSTGDVPNDMSLSEFSDLLGEHMVSRYFPSGHVLYREGDIGNHMYFINSGKIEVTTKDGFRASLKHGDTCGEGGLLNLNRMRSATLRTLTPVHVIQIDRESFTKYLSSSDSVLGMKLREKVNARKFGRAEYIIGKHKDMVETKVPMGHVIFSEGDKADGIYMLSAGMVDVETKRGRRVYDVKPGELFGVQSFLMKKQGRRAFAKCVDSSGCTIKALPADVVESLLKSNPGIRESLMDLALRREFRRAVVEKLDRSFPFDRRGLRKAFNAIDLDKTGQLNLNEVRDLLLNHLADSSITEEEVEALLATLDLQQNGVVDFDEFCSIFRK
jgi:CRP-like cAMP-binding protein